MKIPRRLLPWTLLVAAGCMGPQIPPEIERLQKLHAGSPEERDDAFQDLLRAGDAFIPRLKASMGLAPKAGFPVVGLLYAHGQGNSVPLDLKARHLAAFRWPRAHEQENAVIEPYAWSRIEADLVRAGRPALSVVGQALAGDAPGEGPALRGAGVMLRIGGRAAAEEFARLLGSERDMGGVRVCDVAAAALLHLGRQELLLRLGERDARLAAAREWWARAKEQPESEWTRGALAALVQRWQPKDLEGVRPVIELLAGRTIEDPKDWWEKNADWKPDPPPLDPRSLLPPLGEDRPRAYDANHRLETITGARVHVIRVSRLSELCAAIRLWRPPADLSLRWRRYLESPLLRLSIGVVGYHPQRGTNHLRWTYETHFHPVEEDSGELRIDTLQGSYALYVQARAFGTQLLVSESYGATQRWAGVLREWKAVRPQIAITLPLKSCLLVAVEEVGSRRPPPLPEALQAEWRARLKKMAAAAGKEEARPALRALGYFQDRADRDFLLQHGAGEALLLQGDPAALEFSPQLELHEIEMALRKTDNYRVRDYLDELKAKAPKP